MVRNKVFKVAAPTQPKHTKMKWTTEQKPKINERMNELKIKKKKIDVGIHENCCVQKYN